MVLFDQRKIQTFLFPSKSCHSREGGAGGGNLVADRDIRHRDPVANHVTSQKRSSRMHPPYGALFCHSCAGAAGSRNLYAVVPNRLRERSHSSSKAIETAYPSAAFNFPNSSVASSWIFEKANHLYQKQTCMHRKSARHKKFLSLVAG